MNPINVIPPLDFVYHSNSSMGRERYVSVAEGYRGRSEWRKTYASTITPIQSHGGRKKTLEKSWRKRETFYAIRDIVDELATPMGNYVVGGQSINLFPYETLTPHQLGNMFNPSFSSRSLTFFGTSVIML